MQWWDGEEERGSILTRASEGFEKGANEALKAGPLLPCLTRVPLHYTKLPNSVLRKARAVSERERMRQIIIHIFLGGPTYLDKLLFKKSIVRMVHVLYGSKISNVYKHVCVANALVLPPKSILLKLKVVSHVLMCHTV